MRLVRSGSSWSGRERNCAFLNCQAIDSVGRPKFANLSAVAGLDFLDDGRAVAVCDWDGDGDLDLWLRNRNAPRLRLMINRSEELNSQVRGLIFSLRGTASNRDAVGARVELETDETDGRVRVRTLNAGDAFLSQSSKRVHFGVPSKVAVKAAIVQWPNGTRERFALDRSAFTFQLTQGSGKAQPLPNRSAVTWKAGGAKPLAVSDAARIALPGPVLAPTIKVWNEGGTPTSLESKPKLLIFWTSTCPHCLEELKQLGENQAAIQAAGLQIVPVCLDRVSEINDADATAVPLSDDASALIQQLSIPFPVVQTSVQSMDRLTAFQNALFDMDPDFVVPFGMMVNERGQVLSIYRGAFDFETYSRDLQLRTATLAELRNTAVPCAGSWITQPATNAQFADFIGKRMLSHDLSEGARYIASAMELAESQERREHFRSRLKTIYEAQVRKAARDGDSQRVQKLQEKLQAL